MAWKFINPYNFIPLAEKRNTSRVEEKSEESLSGVITYSLLTRTPLFIPNTSNDHAIKPQAAEGKKEGEAYHKSFEFFAYEDLSGLKEEKKPEELAEPVIPGSEIRGMLRSNYEMLTDSCMSAIEGDAVLSRRNSEVFQPGLIRKTSAGYDLIKAKDCLLRTKSQDNLEVDHRWNDDNAHNIRPCYIQRDLSEGQKVWVKIQKRARGKFLIDEVSFARSAACSQIGYVLKGEKGPEVKDRYDNYSKQNKHCCHILISESSLAASGNILNVDVLDTVLKIYKDLKESPYDEYRREWENFKGQGKQGELFPVYYSIIDDCTEANRKYVMLSPASITREVYKAKLAGMVGDHTPCNDPKHLCPACRLFGTLWRGDEDHPTFSKASSVRFADLKLDGKTRASDSSIQELYDSPKMLRELASPKLGNTEFYLRRPDGAWFWTYDYYIGDDGIARSYTAFINGRKFYWHNLSVKTDDIVTNEETIRNSTIRPLKKNVGFTGKVYFDRISPEELNRLIYLINAGDSEKNPAKKKHGYKLGTGKPLGLGSIALSVDSVKIRKVIRNDASQKIEWREEDYKGYKVPTLDQDILQKFEVMTAFDSLERYVKNGYKVDYPRLEEETDDTGHIYEWFTGNHKGYDHKKDRTVKMPNARSQMYFDAYMEPMTPWIRSTGIARSVGERSQTYDVDEKSLKGKSGQSNAKNPGGYSGQNGVKNPGGYSGQNSMNGGRNTSRESSEEKYRIGESYTVTVTGYNSQKSVAYFRCDGKRGSLYFRNVAGADYGKIDLVLKQGDKYRYRVKYTGKDDKGFDQFRYIGEA